VSGRQAVVQQH